MLYRNLGKTNEEVSVLGFGCMRLPIINGDTTKIDEDNAIKIIKQHLNKAYSNSYHRNLFNI